MISCQRGTPNSYYRKSWNYKTYTDILCSKIVSPKDKIGYDSIKDYSAEKEGQKEQNWIQPIPKALMALKHQQKMPVVQEKGGELIY